MANRSPVRGVKRQKRGGTPRRLKRPGTSAPLEWMATRGAYELPSRKATAAQAEALKALVLDHLRRRVVALYSDLGADLLAPLLGVSVPTAQKLIDGRPPWDADRAEALLVARALEAMHRGEIAGVLGTRRTLVSRFLFTRLRQADLRGLRPAHPGTPDLDILAAAARIDLLEWEGT